MAKSSTKLHSVSSAAEIVSMGFSKPQALPAILSKESPTASYAMWRTAVTRNPVGYIESRSPATMAVAHGFFLEAKKCFLWEGFSFDQNFYMQFMNYLADNWGEDASEITKLLKKHHLSFSFVWGSGSFPKLTYLAKSGNIVDLAKLYIADVLAPAKKSLQSSKFEVDCTGLVASFAKEVILVKEPQGSECVQIIDPMISNHPKFSTELLALTEKQVSATGVLIKSWSKIPPEEVISLVTAIRAGKASLDALISIL
jgi:hypothetical protein